MFCSFFAGLPTTQIQGSAPRFCLLADPCRSAHVRHPGSVGGEDRYLPEPVLLGARCPVGTTYPLPVRRYDHYGRTYWSGLVSFLASRLYICLGSRVLRGSRRDETFF